MRRALLLGAILALTGGTAEAKLTIHRAKNITRNIATNDIRHGGIDHYRINRCKRVTPTYVWCELYEWGEVYQPGMPDGEGMYYVDMRVRRSAVLASTPLGTDWY